jgi:hypothetical protein
MHQVIGIDFDNTIICYDEVFHRLAVEAGLIAAEAPRRQKAIREAARNSPEGDLAWQRLQGQAYGPRIQEARPAEGALHFLGRCREAGVEVHVISHKTRFASVDPSCTDLRIAARDWMHGHGFFSPVAGLTPDHFHCGGSRAEKVGLIRSTGCACFIDDLVETFREEGFPAGVQAILYAPGEEPGVPDLPGLWVARSWQEISRGLFGD